MNGHQEEITGTADPAATRPAAPPAPPAEAPPNWNRAAYTPSDPREKSPLVASVLSVAPGLGQVYVGYYQVGFIHALVVASIITLLASNLPDRLIPLFALFMGFFWLYNIIDAGRRATFYNQALRGESGVELPGKFASMGFGGSILGGSLLIFFGMLFLLHNVVGISLDWIEDWWPLAPVLFGVYLVVRGVQDRQK